MPDLDYAKAWASLHALQTIVSTPVKHGGDASDVMAVLENTIVGVLSAIQAWGVDAPAHLDHLRNRVAIRMQAHKVTVPGLVGHG